MFIASRYGRTYVRAYPCMYSGMDRWVYLCMQLRRYAGRPKKYTWLIKNKFQCTASAVASKGSFFDKNP